MFSGRRKAQCRRVRDMLSEYLDDRLGHEDQDIVEHHLEACEACSSELESLRMTVEMLHRVPVVPAPRSFAISGVETERVSILDPQRLRWLRPATAVVTVVLVVLLAVDFLQVLPQGIEVTDDGVFTEHFGTVSLSASEREEYMIESEFGEPAEVPPVPAPRTAQKGSTDEYNLEESDTMGDTGSARSLDAPTSGWPLRQIEIALAVVVFTMVAVLLFARRRRRRWSR